MSGRGRLNRPFAENARNKVLEGLSKPLGRIISRFNLFWYSKAIQESGITEQQSMARRSESILRKTHADCFDFSTGSLSFPCGQVPSERRTSFVGLADIDFMTNKGHEFRSRLVFWHRHSEAAKYSDIRISLHRAPGWSAC